MSTFVKKWFMFRNRDSILFLLIAIGISLCFKAAIGFFLTFNGYGFSVVTPPISLLFASLDIMLAIGVFFLFDKISAKPLRLISYHLIIITSALIFYSNYIVYEYFRTFINWGLVSFNGAGVREITSYMVEDLGSKILLFSFIIVCYLTFFFRKELGQIFFKKQQFFAVMLIVCIIVFLFLAKLGMAETGKMIRNPFIEFSISVIDEMVFLNGAVDVENFEPPEHLVFGEKGFNGSVVVAPEHDKVENVLVIMVELLSLEMTSIANPKEKSFEIIDKLKDRSVIFDSYRTNFPGTSRSFISANCGTLPGTAQETITNYMYDFRCHSVADVFNKAGYKTGFFASSMFTYDNLSSSEFVKKYSVFRDFLSLKDKYDNDGKLYSYQVKDSDTTNEAYEFMLNTKKSGDKFFTFVFLYSTHYPYNSPNTSDKNKGSVENYRKTQSYVSEVIENLLDRMKSKGILDNTVVAITADHGEAFSKRQGVRGHGHSLYEESIKIPLIISLPGLKQGTVLHKSGTHIDLAPTLTALTGLGKHSDWQGNDLFDNTVESKPVFIFTRSSTRLNGVIDGNLKYIYNVTEKTEKLFDLKNDPDELKNIAQEKTKESQYYKTLVEKWAVYQQKWITAK